MGVKHIGPGYRITYRNHYVYCLRLAEGIRLALRKYG